MSAKAYAPTSTDELIDEFVRVAESLSSLWTFWFKTPKKTQEREEMNQDLKAIGAELRARKPIEKLRPLFDHENVDVRFHAVWAFMAIDPDWAIATISAHTADLSTKDVIALRARAKKRPPARPTPKQMSTDQLAARFEDAAVREYATRFLGGEFEPHDVKRRNAIIGEIRGIVDELKSRDALPVLLPFLDHSNITVRNSAAIYCLDIAPERALPVLQTIAAGRDQVEANSASWAIDRRREREGKAPSP
jgi:HEAT repeat protein